MEILKTIFFIIAGSGGLLAIIKFLTDMFSRSTSKSRNILINNMNFWKMEAEKNIIKSEDKDRKILDLLNEIVSLKVQITQRRTDFETIPLLYMRLDSKARMIDFTNLYSKTFIGPLGKNPFSYYGKTSEEFWGIEIGAEYTRNDLKVLNNGRPFYGTESLIIEDKNYLENYLIYKWLSYTHSGEKNLNVLIIDDEELVKLFKNFVDAK